MASGVAQMGADGVAIRRAKGDVRVEATHVSLRYAVLPNGSRLSCGRNAGGRKEVERLIELVGEATQFFSACERPAASSAC